MLVARVRSDESEIANTRTAGGSSRSSGVVTVAGHRQQMISHPDSLLVCLRDPLDLEVGGFGTANQRLTLLTITFMDCDVVT